MIHMKCQVLFYLKKKIAMLFYYSAETIYMKCQILFSRKNKKKYFKMSSTEIFTQHAKC